MLSQATMVEILSRCPLFAGLPADFIEFLPLWGQVKTFPAGARLFNEGEPGDSLFVVLDGQLRICLAIPGLDRWRTVRLCGPGEVIGEMSIFDELPRSATGLCSGPCTVFELDRQNFNDLLHKEPGVAFRLVRTITGLLRQTLDREQDLIRQLQATNKRLDQYVQSLRQKIARATQDLRTANDSLRDQADRDPLTGLHHRAYFLNRLEEMLQDKKQDRLSLILLDVDNFKHTNELHGFLTGDRIIIEVAEALRSLAPRALVARCGAEEYSLALPCRKPTALRRGREIRRAIAGRGFAGLEPGQITVKFGVATYPDDAATCQQLLSAADRALQQQA